MEIAIKIATAIVLAVLLAIVEVNMFGVKSQRTVNVIHDGGM